MRIYKMKNYNDMSRKAANIVLSQVNIKPNCVLGLATGSTPEGLYEQLVQWYKNGDVDFSEVKSVNLDEYKGIGKDNDQSYYYYMYNHLFKHINIDLKNTNIPNGMAEDSQQECKNYDNIIESLGGIDLQILGIGANGHIGFNEPSNEFAKGTHCVALTESTIQANARFFKNKDEVPKYALSMGVKSIMQAKKILLVANGESKADALYKSVNGPITPDVPASVLQLHNDVIIVADEAALSKFTF